MGSKPAIQGWTPEGHMMDEKQLLQLAAKAAGYRLNDHTDIKGRYWPWCYDLGMNWNPLHNDGDAFRLAVRLNLVIEPPRDNGFAHVYHYHRSLEVAERRSAITHEAELTATRRAIVRAAAEIGRGMK